MNEKRGYERHTLWLPVTIHAENAQAWAVCRDASVTGIYVSGSARLEVGDIVQVHFRVSPTDEEERTVEGRIVRVEGPALGALRGASDPRWPYKMAIEFLDPQPELELLLKNLSIPPPPSD